MKYIISVDGGGTKTEIVVTDLNGKVLSKKIGGSCNPNDIGKENMVSVIVDLIEKVLPPDCDFADIGLGISGIFVANAEEYLCTQLKSKFSFFDKIEVISDKDSAMNSAYKGDGCIVIIGTGSVGLVRRNGCVTNLGGGGYLVDDALSGFDLGREVLNAVLCDNDGIGEKTILTELFNAKVGENIRTHLKTVYLKGKSYVASFSPLVFEGLEKGDSVSTQIMQKCVKGFERLVLGVLKAWGEDSCEITIFGGLSNKIEIIKEYLTPKTKEKITFKKPSLPIIYGPIRNIASNNEFIGNFLQTYLQV